VKHQYFVLGRLWVFASPSTSNHRELSHHTSHSTDIRIPPLSFTTHPHNFHPRSSQLPNGPAGTLTTYYCTGSASCWSTSRDPISGYTYFLLPPTGSPAVHPFRLPWSLPSFCQCSMQVCPMSFGRILKPQRNLQACCYKFSQICPS
jgi:hypothetical protein